MCGPCARRRGGRDAHSCIYRTENLPFSQSPPSYGHSARDNATRQEHLVLTPSSRADVGNTVHEHSRVPSDTLASDNDVDAMGCIDSGALRSGLLGASSGASLTQQIRQAVDGNDTPDQGTKGSRLTHVTTKLLKLRRKRDKEKDSSELQLVLPQRRTADHLFEVYWAYSDIIFPWLDEAEIRRQYASLWISNDDSDIDEKVFYCTLNLMFAIAVKLDPLTKPETRVKLANTYYERAQDLLSFNLLDISHFEILQALLLAAQYLQSTNMPRQCFQILGLALWVAQDLGLHLPETTCLLTDPYEQQLARRVWHGCIMMDKYHNLKPANVQLLTSAESHQ